MILAVLKSLYLKQAGVGTCCSYSTGVKTPVFTCLGVNFNTCDIHLNIYLM